MNDASRTSSNIRVDRASAPPRRYARSRAPPPRVGEAYAAAIQSRLDAIRRHVAPERLCFGDGTWNIFVAGVRKPCPVSKEAPRVSSWHADYARVSRARVGRAYPVSATTVDAKSGRQARRV